VEKVKDRIADIFSHAVALQQNGRLKNRVFCIDDEIYILNMDMTIILKFTLRKGEAPFKSPVSFDANDYESNMFKEKNGRIIFVTKKGDYVKEKSCRTPQLSPKDVREMYNKLIKETKKKNKACLNQDFVSCLDTDLSHIEFSGEKGKLVAKQRNIYSGSVITITKTEEQKGFDIQSDKIEKDFKPIGIRTDDFLSLFQFVGSVVFYFYKDSIIRFESGEKRMAFEGILSQCVYDELGKE